MMHIIYILLIFITPMLAFSQEGADVQQRDFKKEEWRRATQGIDYSKDLAKERKPRQQRKGTDANLKIGGNASFILKALIILLLGIVLFFLLRILLGLNQPKNKAVKPVLSVEELAQLEENLHQADLDYFINQAIVQGDYTLAVRLYYLATLKELSLKHYIHWKKDKTNRDYLREMNRTSMAMPFSEITLLFERIWYGNVQLQQGDFEEIQPKFSTFI